MVTIQIIFALTVSREWELHQLDVNNAFLQGDLVENVYMHPPQGFSKP